MRIYNIHTKKILCYVGITHPGTEERELYNPSCVVVTQPQQRMEFSRRGRISTEDGQYVIVADRGNHKIKWYKLSISNTPRSGYKALLVLKKSIGDEGRIFFNIVDISLKTHQDQQTLLVIDREFLSEWTMNGKFIRKENIQMLLHNKLNIKKNPTIIPEELAPHIIEWAEEWRIMTRTGPFINDDLNFVVELIGVPTHSVILPKSGNIAIICRVLGIIIIDYKTLEVMNIIYVSSHISGIAADSEDNIIVRLKSQQNKLQIYSIEGNLLSERPDFPFLSHVPLPAFPVVDLTIHWTEENQGLLVFPNQDQIVIYKPE